MGNGHMGNGHMGNGHMGNGHMGNGHMGNGHMGNGICTHMQPGAFIDFAGRVHAPAAAGARRMTREPMTRRTGDTKLAVASCGTKSWRPAGVRRTLTRVILYYSAACRV